jgi:hypothetical protein
MSRKRRCGCFLVSKPSNLILVRRSNTTPDLAAAVDPLFSEGFLDQMTKALPGLILLGAALLLGGSSLAYPETALDTATSMYIGQTIVEGGVPYRDAWEARGPGIYFAFALETFLLGKSAFSVRFFDLLWQFGTALLLYVICVQMFQQRAPGLIAGILYLIFYYSQYFSSWAEPDGFLTLPLALAYFLCLRGLDSPRVLPWGLAAAAVGITALFKSPYGLFGLGMLYAVFTREQRKSGKIFVRLAAMALGFLVPLIFCAAYFFLKGGLADLLTTQFVFVPQYVARIHEIFKFRDFVASAFRPFFLPLHILVLIGLGSVIVSIVRRERIGVPVRLLVIWFAVAVSSFFMHGSYLAYHYLPFCAPLLLLSLGTIHFLYSGFREKGMYTQVLLVAVAIAVFSMPGKRLGEHVLYAWRSLRREIPIATWLQVGAYLQRHTSPEETIVVWGNVPDIYLRAERKAATRFLCTGYLAMTTHGVNYRKVFQEELRKNNPAYFMLVKQSSLTPGLPDSLTSFQEFGELRTWLASGYEVEMNTEQYTLFRRKGRPAS